MLFFIVLTDTSGVDVVFFSLFSFSQHIKNETDETKNTLPVNSKDAHIFFYVKETKNFFFLREEKIQS